MSYACGPADWIDLAIGRLEDSKRSLRECDRLQAEIKKDGSEKSENMTHIA